LNETNPGRPHLLPARPDLPPAIAAGLAADSARFALEGLPADLPAYLREAYGLDVSARYAGLPVSNPWGKGSGQLSMRAGQVQDAADAGLGFVVLKTVIAQDAQGRQSMGAWAIKEARMVAEPIKSKQTGAEGWTVTWKGRGWWQPFDAYLALVRESVAIGLSRGMVVAPSVKYHLPAPGETAWRVAEYRDTTRAIVEACRSAGLSGPIPLEKDFSPTLAGSDRAGARATILDWLARVPDLVRDGAGPETVHLGLKLFNALDTDDFQRQMLRSVHDPARADFLVYGNRLFDPDREFDGQKGVAYGGPDLSDRNLAMLSRLRADQAEGVTPAAPLEISATGDISSGRLAVEYALRGCTSFQLHTLFQLPDDAYAMRRGSKLSRALHRLTFDPLDGFVAWLVHATNRLGTGGRFLDVAEVGARRALTAADLA
jgi:dihydroorotate dehydrogenase